ncbi:MAG: OmpA family protein [Fibromonadaceae bacterium]|jgi:outer membrane protein OmpA-like peptidoglycan-associated protein|nr:OmpA family protein [Fibromonadaceae bacterium]
MRTKLNNKGQANHAPTKQGRNRLALFTAALALALALTGCGGSKPRPMSEMEIFVLEGVKFQSKPSHFQSGTSDITEDSFTNLMQVVKMMQTYPEMSFKIIGHTDNSNEREASQKLSEDRAKAVMDFLVSCGIDADRLDFGGKGPDQPISSNKTAEGRAKNSRIEFKRTDNF